MSFLYSEYLNQPQPLGVEYVIFERSVHVKKLSVYKHNPMRAAPIYEI